MRAICNLLEYPQKLFSAEPGIMNYLPAKPATDGFTFFISHLFLDNNGKFSAPDYYSEFYDSNHKIQIHF